MQLTARNATLDDLAALLGDQQARKVDVVAPASTLRSVNGALRITGTEPVLTDDGVTSGDGFYVPTAVCDEGLADKLGVPLAYLRRMREERPDLYDGNVNGWLHGRQRVRFADSLPEGETGSTWREQVFPVDPRSFLVRCFRGDDGPGVARAFLSRNYRILDHFDVLTAALEGVRDAGVNIEVKGCDLTERRMRVRVTAPGIAAYAPVLLAGYRSPFTGATAEANPLVFAGFEIGNSETGGGAFTITPRLVVQVCNNGLTITKDVLRSVHLGGKLDDGVIRWSSETQDNALRLVVSQARDAVATFLDIDYVTAVLARVEEQAATPVSRPQETIETLGRTLRFSQERTDGIVDAFIRGGQMTAGGVLNAVTAYAQTVDDADDAAEIEAAGLRALELAAS